MSNHTLGDFPRESAELQLPINGGVDITILDIKEFGFGVDFGADWSSAPSQIPQDPYLAAASEGVFGADWSSAPSQIPQDPYLAAASEGVFGADWSSARSQIPQGTPHNIAQQFTAPIPTALTQHPARGQPIIHDIPQHTTAFSAPAGQVIVTMPGSSTPQTTEDDRIRCPKGCPKTFRRTGDYRRHMKKHDDPIFKCVAIECDKKFYRLDKLRSHVKGHGINL